MVMDGKNIKVIHKFITTGQILQSIYIGIALENEEIEGVHAQR